MTAGSRRREGEKPRRATRGDQPERAEDRVGRNDRLSPVGGGKRLGLQEEDGKRR